MKIEVRAREPERRGGDAGYSFVCKQNRISLMRACVTTRCAYARARDPRAALPRAPPARRR